MAVLLSAHRPCVRAGDHQVRQTQGAGTHRRLLFRRHQRDVGDLADCTGGWHICGHPGTGQMVAGLRHSAGVSLAGIAGIDHAQPLGSGDRRGNGGRILFVTSAAARSHRRRGDRRYRRFAE